MAAFSTLSILSAAERRNEFLGSDPKAWTQWTQHFIATLRPYLPS